MGRGHHEIFAKPREGVPLFKVWNPFLYDEVHNYCQLMTS
jgi:hypothetical protein